MKMLVLLFTAGILAHTSVSHAAADLFTNTRESGSRHISKTTEAEIKEFVNNSDVSSLVDQYNTVLTKEENVTCASFIIRDVKKLKIDKRIKFQILVMRHLNLTDDVATDLLLKSAKMKYRKGLTLSNITPEISEFSAEYASYVKNINKGKCPEDSFRSFIASINKKDINNNHEIKKLNKIALKNKLINKSTFKQIEMMRQAKVHELRITLRDYVQKRRSVLRQVQTDVESSEFVTQKRKDIKTSLRQYLYQNYNYFQILMMGNLVKKMKTRLQAQDISIVITDRDNDTEIIPLEPMEKFRFVLKLMRKELAEMNNSSVFENSYATFLAVIAASYEVGNIPAIELEELASLEDIWNPKKTKWEKAMVWMRNFGGVASLLIPGPYGFLPMLSIMVIDVATAKPTPYSDTDYSLF